MRVIGWGASDVGRKRNHNEDSFLCNNDFALYAVADGMGGHLGGERASRMAVDILEREIVEVRQAGQLDVRPRGALPPGAPHPVARSCARPSSRPTGTSTRRRMANPELAGMGTTLTALLFRGGYVHLGHVATRARTSTATGAPGSSPRITPGSRSRCAPA